MTTFQSIIYAIVGGAAEFLPISSKAHFLLLPEIIGWQPPSPGLIAALGLGSFLALLIYFRHDWASMISCCLQVIIFRKRPMTLDERLPFFIGLTYLMGIASSSYFTPRINSANWTPLVVALSLALGGLPLLVTDHLSRKTRGMFDWNWLHATFLGLALASALVPGWDPMSALLAGALFLNYKRESATKFAYYVALPLLVTENLSNLKEVNFHSSAPIGDLSWLSFSVAAVISLLIGLLTIGSFIKHVQQNGLGKYVTYRWIVAAGAGAYYWLKLH